MVNSIWSLRFLAESVVMHIAGFSLILACVIGGVSTRRPSLSGNPSRASPGVGRRTHRFRRAMACLRPLQASDGHKMPQVRNSTKPIFQAVTLFAPGCWFRKGFLGVPTSTSTHWRPNTTPVL